MFEQPAPLAEAIAALRAAALADAARHDHARIDALFLALLACLLGRLERMVELWQAGRLTPPRRTTTPARPDSVRARRPGQSPPAHARDEQTRAAFPPHGRAFLRPAPRTHHRRNRPASQAPPAARPSHPSGNTSGRGRPATPIILRNRN